MKGFWKWAALFLAVVIIAFCVALPFFGRFALGSMPMMRGWPGGMHMPGGFGFFGGGLRILLMLFVPLAAMALGVLVVFALVKVFSRPQVQPPAAPAPAQVVMRACTHCGKPLQEDWTACPYCGEKI